MGLELQAPTELRAFLEAKFERQEQLLKELRDEIVLQGDEHHMAGPMSCLNIKKELTTKEYVQDLA